LIRDERLINAAQTLESFHDRTASIEERDLALREFEIAAGECFEEVEDDVSLQIYGAINELILGSIATASSVACALATHPSRYQEINDPRWRAAWDAESQVQASILRDIFGNPFRPVTLDPRWLTSSVLDLTRIIYDDRAFERMPILADALMDAGCNSEEIIAHCRSDGPHVRGCWVVDLILGKE
jgi:hypothetical protein